MDNNLEVLFVTKLPCVCDDRNITIFQVCNWFRQYNLSHHFIHEMENYPGNSSTRITSSNIPRIELQKETAAELEDEEK